MFPQAIRAATELKEHSISSVVSPSKMLGVDVGTYSSSFRNYHRVVRTHN